MSTTDKKGVLRKLVELGRSKGFLTNQEIMDALSEINFSPEQIEKLYDKLETNGIEIVENSVEDMKLDDIAPDEPSTYDGSLIDDPVKMYLREIGNIPMLTPEEEKDIARRIAEGDESVFLLGEAVGHIGFESAVVASEQFEKEAAVRI